MFGLDFLGKLKVWPCLVLVLASCQGPSEPPKLHDIPDPQAPGDSTILPPNQGPLLPPDSMALALVRVHLAEAYRARYFIMHSGDSRSNLGMVSLYDAALAPLGIRSSRLETSYRHYLAQDPIALQQVYERCDLLLQQQTW